MTLTEEEQAKALRDVLAALDAYERAGQDVADKAARAIRVAGVSVNRLAGVTKVSRTKVEAWLRQSPESAAEPDE